MPEIVPDIANAKLKRLYEYWATKRGDRRFPARADIDPVDMAFALGNVILAEVLPETPPRFRIRLHGTTLTRRVGYDLTGKMLDEMPVPEFRDLSTRSFTKVAQTGEPLHVLADRLVDARMQRYEAILMPLSSDGQRVDMLLVGLSYDGDLR
ncbi:MAG TPA: PAS domain-containing protein [Stellaceae bacterium]|jgi:hypothetical protein|nr:PAS domain-containing protein [Stellaceae bacterium]